MYRDTITLFNLHAGTWHAHVLSGVDLNVDRGAILAKYGAQCTDRAQLHIRYTGDVIGAYSVVDAKAYAEESGTLTLRAAETGETPDFFIEGAWDGGDVSDADYTDGFFDYMQSKYSACYAITSVAKYSVIQHYEVLAK